MLWIGILKQGLQSLQVLVEHAVVKRVVTKEVLTAWEGFVFEESSDPFWVVNLACLHQALLTVSGGNLSWEEFGAGPLTYLEIFD